MDTFLGQELVITPRTGEGLTESTYGRPFPAACRFQEVSQVITSEAGEVVTSAAKVFLPAATSVSFNDELTYGGKTYKVLKVARRRDLDAEYHVEVWLGR